MMIVCPLLEVDLRRILMASQDQVMMCESTESAERRATSYKPWDSSFKSSPDLEGLSELRLLLLSSASLLESTQERVEVRCSRTCADEPS